MDWRSSHASDQRTCTRCPITFIANEDIEIVESNDNEDSENDDEDVSTDVSDNDDSDWNMTATIILLIWLLKLSTIKYF